MKIAGIEIDNLTLASVAVVLVLFVGAFLYFSTKAPEPPKITVSEQPLVPVATLQVFPGEEYTYEYDVNGTKGYVTYSVGKGDGCTNLIAKTGNASITACMGEHGELPSLSFESPEGKRVVAATDPEGAGLWRYVDLVQPWMLSLAPNFTWQMNTTITYSFGIEGFSATEMKVEGEENVMGRDAYRVKLTQNVFIDGAPQGTDEQVRYVDKEKRVLLYVTSSAGTMELVHAPFPLERYAG